MPCRGKVCSPPRPFISFIVVELLTGRWYDFSIRWHQVLTYNILVSYRAEPRYSLIATGNVDQAAIFNVEGTSVWAASPNFTVCRPWNSPIYRFLFHVFLVHAQNILRGFKMENNKTSCVCWLMIKIRFRQMRSRLPYTPSQRKAISSSRFKAPAFILLGNGMSP